MLFFKELGRAFQSLAALTLNERPPSDSRLKQGQTKFNEPYLLFLSLMSEFNMVKMVSDTCTLFSCYRSLPLLNFSILKRNKKKKHVVRSYKYIPFPAPVQQIFSSNVD